MAMTINCGKNPGIPPACPVDALLTNTDGNVEAGEVLGAPPGRKKKRRGSGKGHQQLVGQLGPLRGQITCMHHLIHHAIHHAKH